jgi:hypothetical protein
MGFLASLQSLRGSDFDREYARQQVLAHTSALTTMRSYAASGSDANLRRAAAFVMPIIERHLLLARQMKGASAEANDKNGALCRCSRARLARRVPGGTEFVASGIAAPPPAGSAYKKPISQRELCRKQPGCFQHQGQRDYRLITAVAFRFEAIYIKFIGTHAEYDPFTDKPCCSIRNLIASMGSGGSK